MAVDARSIQWQRDVEHLAVLVGGELRFNEHCDMATIRVSDGERHFERAYGCRDFGVDVDDLAKQFTFLMKRAFGYS